jgi:hypothetical protein
MPQQTSEMELRIGGNPGRTALRAGVDKFRPTYLVTRTSVCHLRPTGSSCGRVHASMHPMRRNSFTDSIRWVEGLSYPPSETTPSERERASIYFASSIVILWQTHYALLSCPPWSVRETLPPVLCGATAYQNNTHL